MRAWRALKGTGAAALRDGVYVLPNGAKRHALFTEVADDIEAAGGQAWLLTTESPKTAFATLFDRTEDYQRLAVEIQDCLASLASHTPQENARLARKLRKSHVALNAVDFFPGEAQRQVLTQLDALDQRLQARLSPGEPKPRQAEITRLDIAAYQNRVWATRAHLWVDRMASAWLIQRFIDQQACFLWLATPADCPAEALGFDFDGAKFTHTVSHAGNRVSFETLMASFGLEGDAALKKLAEVVHFLDIGGLPVPEAPGLETLLAGMRASLPDDDALLAATCQTFDFLYTHYQQRETTQ
jgi:hypothetical protein